MNMSRQYKLFIKVRSANQMGGGLSYPANQEMNSQFYMNEGVYTV